MPSASLFGCTLRQLSTDNTLFYFLIAVVQVIWLFIYWIGIAAFARPQNCDPGTQSSPQQWPLVFLCLALFIAQAAVTCAAVFVSLRGTPFEPSKRRWIAPLSYAYLLSLPINAGLLAWGGWVVEAGDGSCWSSGNKKMPATIFFGGIGVLLGQAVGVLITYNQLGDVKAGVWWHSATRTGISSVVHLCGSFRQKHRGPAPVLEEIATELQRMLGGIRADKTDAVAALVCAALLQDEAAARAAQLAVAEQQQQQVQQGKPGAEAGPEDSPGGGSSSPQSSSGWSPALLDWAQGVCSSAAAASTAVLPGMAAPGAAGAEAASEALCWARYAAAAYGARQHMWRRGQRSSCASRRQLSQLAAKAAAAGAQPLAGWGPAGKLPNKAASTDFAAAWELLGCHGAGSNRLQIVCFSSGDKRRGLLPHLVAVDREQHSVVLGIAGNWQRPHAVPVVAPVPPGWLASSAAQAGAGSAVLATGSASQAGHMASNGTSDCTGGSPGSSPNISSSGSSSSWAHKESLEAAQVLLQELERSQVLHQLLQPSGSSGGGTSGTAGQAAGGAGPLERGCCSGFRLVLAGHGVGAGAAALLALKLHSWVPDLEVWAYGPPGELCSADLAAALLGCCRMTSVVVGDDVAPCATSAALHTLVDQSVVALARLRYSKLQLLAALVGERLGPRGWEGWWLAPAKALRPLSEVPAEAQTWLQRFHDWQRQQHEHGKQQQSRQHSSLPGRVLFVCRLASQAAAAGGEGGAVAAGSSSNNNSSRASASANGSDASSNALDAQWQASWVSGDQLAGRGIRVSRHAMSDHYVSRLLGLLGELAANTVAAETEHGLVPAVASNV